MCGIFGIIGNDDVTNKIVNGLKKLEYRGYDSAGISVINENYINTVKSYGKVAELEKKISFLNLSSNIGIGHTRWATHGKASEINSHPHMSCNGFVSVVHNGIIENYIKIKKSLENNGFIFSSETDTEVIPNLIEYNYKECGDYKKSIELALAELEGSFSLGIIFKNNNSEMYAVKNNSPLVIGIGEKENYIASSISAFSTLTNKILHLQDGDIAVINSKEYNIYNISGELLKREVEIVEDEDSLVEMDKFDSFMLKEINEQPKVLKRIIAEYIDNDKINLSNFSFDIDNISHITIVACGTSYYAGCTAKYFLEDITGIPVNVDIASEFRYRNPPMINNGLSLFISQSGETADTIAALKYSKSFGQKIVSLVNVTNSSIANLSDLVIKTLAGIEIGVASTKAFMAQVSILYLLAMEIGYRRGKLNFNDIKSRLLEFKKLPSILENQLSESNVDNISNISKTIVDRKFMMYIGKGVYYPIALEGALKFKEISYIPTDGIASGELKHGSIALIDNSVSIVAINPCASNGEMFEKSHSSIEECKSRDGEIILISDDLGIEKVGDKVHHSIEIVNSFDKNIQAISSIISVQLIAYFTALYKGNNIDKPRNLAKSVTVE